MDQNTKANYYYFPVYGRSVWALGVGVSGGCFLLQIWLCYVINRIERWIEKAEDLEDSALDCRV